MFCCPAYFCALPKKRSDPAMDNRRTTTRRRRFAFAGVVAVLSLGMEAAVQPSKLLVCHLDFNSIQMNTGAVVRTLDHVAAKGYNAVLWEIEDKVRFACAPEIAAPDAFSREEFRSILRHAERLGLEPIPLLQTFGHGEYVLDVDGYRELREDPTRKDCYCPSNPKTVAFQKKLLREYLEVFGPRMRRLHLGGDEAEAFGTCAACREKDKAGLYIGHLETLAAELRAKGIRPCVWHDMLQRFDRSGGAFARLPSDFSIWYWEYFYTGCEEEPRGWAKGAETALAAERKKGREIVLAASTQCYIDDPFLTRTREHRANLAGIAAVARKGEFSGLCVTAWSCHRGLKELQYPLFDFAAKRFLAPSAASEDDWTAIVRRDYGAVSVETLDELTAWGPEFYRIDGRSWSDYKDGAVMPRGAALAVYGKDSDKARQLAARARDCATRVRAALLRMMVRSDTRPLAHLAIEAGELKLAYLDMLAKGLEGVATTNAPVERATRFYRREQSPHSAQQTVEILYNGYLDGQISRTKSSKSPE